MSFKVAICGLDDDEETLELIKDDFKAAGITDFSFFDNREDFIKSLTKDVRLVIIDHYINGEGIGPEVVKEVQDNDRKLEKLMPTKIIIMTGQKRPELFVYYMREGCEYLDKNEAGFHKMLVAVVERSVSDIRNKIEFMEGTLNALQGMREAVKHKKK